VPECIHTVRSILEGLEATTPGLTIPGLAWLLRDRWKRRTVDAAVLRLRERGMLIACGRWRRATKWRMADR